MQKWYTVSSTLHPTYPKATFSITQEQHQKEQLILIQHCQPDCRAYSNVTIFFYIKWLSVLKTVSQHIHAPVKQQTEQIEM